VAAYPEIHPQARSADSDIMAFATKVRAGANSAITQYFYSADAYFRFVDDVRAMGVSVPVIPGIMPIVSSTQLMRFSDACGAEIPRWIRLRLQGFGDDSASIKAFGLDVVTHLCAQLRSGGAPGLHFYTLNQSTATLQICQRSLRSRPSRHQVASASRGGLVCRSVSCRCAGATAGRAALAQRPDQHLFPARSPPALQLAPGALGRGVGASGGGCAAFVELGGSQRGRHLYRAGAGGCQQRSAPAAHHPGQPLASCQVGSADVKRGQWLHAGGLHGRPGV